MRRLEQDSTKKKYTVPPGWYIDQVFNDPEFSKELLEAVLGKALPPNYFLKKYLIPDSYILSSILTSNYSDSTGIFSIYDENLALVVKLSKNITKKDYINSWELIQWYKRTHLGITKQVSKRKPPQYPELLYAIHKARNGEEALTFSEIYRKYERGQLPYYDKKTKPFNSEDSLERYYQKHAPKPPVT